MSENAPPNVVCLPQHWHVRPIRLPDAGSGQDHDPSNETVVGRGSSLAGLCMPSKTLGLNGMILGWKDADTNEENDSTGDEIEIEQWRSSYQDRCK